MRTYALAKKLETLIEKFPSLFPSRKGYNGEEYPFNFEINNGWYEIILDACFKLESLMRKIELKFPEQHPPYISRINERYGELQIELTYDTPELELILEEAQKKSLKTCETCGALGMLRTDGWYYVSCSRHVK